MSTFIPAHPFNARAFFTRHFFFLTFLSELWKVRGIFPVYEPSFPRRCGLYGCLCVALTIIAQRAFSHPGLSCRDGCLHIALAITPRCPSHRVAATSSRWRATIEATCGCACGADPCRPSRKHADARGDADTPRHHVRRSAGGAGRLQCAAPGAAGRRVPGHKRVKAADVPAVRVAGAIRREVCQEVGAGDGV